MRDRAPAARRRRGRIGLEQQAAQLPVGVTAEVQPAHRLLARITPLGVGDAADFIQPHFLRNRLLIDFRSESRPSRQNPRQLQRLRAGGVGPGIDQAPLDGCDAVGGCRDLKNEGRQVAAPRHLEGQLGCRAFQHTIRCVRNRDGGGAHDRHGVRPCYAQYGGFFGAIGRPCEPRRNGALQNLQCALTALGRHRVPNSRSEAGSPAVHDHHPLGREQRAVHERPVAGLLDVVGEQALKAGDGAGTGSCQLDDCDVGAGDDRTGAQLIDDFRGHRIRLEARDRGRWSSRKDVAHRSASSAAECPASESHTLAAPRPASASEG